MAGPGRKEQIAQIRNNEREAIRSAQRVEKEKLSAERLTARASLAQHNANERAKASLDKQRSQALFREHTARERKLQQERESRVSFIKSTVGTGAGRVFGAIGAIGKAGVAATGLSGAALAASSINQAVQLDEMARRTSIQGRNAGEAGVDPNELRRRYTQTAIKSGLSPEEIASGVGKYVDFTGDIQGGLRHMDTWATVSQASNAPMADLASATAALKSGDITSKEDVASSLSTLYAQGKKGSFKLSDQAQFLPQLIGRGKDFGAHGLSGIKALGGLLQMTQDVTHNAPETATSVKDMYSELTKKAGKMASGKAFGGRKVDVYEGGDAKNGGRDIDKVVGDTLVASRGDSTQLEDVFGKRAMPALQGMLNTFKETRLAAMKGGDKEEVATLKGKDAAMKMWSAASDVPGTFEDTKRDASDTMKSTSVQFEIVMTRLKDAMSSQLLPEVVKLIPQLAALVPLVGRAVAGFTQIVGWLLNNPFKGIGYALGIAIAAEAAKARIATVLTAALTSMVAGFQAGGIRGGLGTLIPATSGTTGASALAAAGTGLAIGAAVAGTIYTGGVAKFEAGEAGMAQGGAALNDVRGAGVGDLDRVREQIAEQKKRVAEAGKTDVLDDVLDWGGASNKKVEAKTQQNFLDEMTKKLASLEMQQAAAQLKEAADALKASSGNGKDGSPKPNTGDKPTGIKQ